MKNALDSIAVCAQVFQKRRGRGQLLQGVRCEDRDRFGEGFKKSISAGIVVVELYDVLPEPTGDCDSIGRVFAAADFETWQVLSQVVEIVAGTAAQFDQRATALNGAARGQAQQLKLFSNRFAHGHQQQVAAFGNADLLMRRELPQLQPDLLCAHEMSILAMLLDPVTLPFVLVFLVFGVYFVSVAVGDGPRVKTHDPGRPRRPRGEFVQWNSDQFSCCGRQKSLLTNKHPLYPSTSLLSVPRAGDGRGDES